MSQTGTKSVEAATLQDVADVVRRRREELRLRYSDIAAIAGVSRHLAASLENGEPNDQIEKALRIFAVLQIDLVLRTRPPRHVVPPPAADRPARTRETPAVPIETMFDVAGRVACLECGAPVRDLGRHVSSMHGIGIPTYRQRWGIGPDTGLVPRGGDGA